MVNKPKEAKVIIPPETISNPPKTCLAGLIVISLEFNFSRSSKKLLILIRSETRLGFSKAAPNIAGLFKAVAGLLTSKVGSGSFEV